MKKRVSKSISQIDVKTAHSGIKSGRKNDADTPDRDLYDLWRLINRVRRAMWKASSKELAPFGVTPEQAGVLYILNNVLPNATHSQISRIILIEHHTISGILQRMEAKDFVKREVDGERKHVFKYSITPKGKEVYRHALKRQSVQTVVSSLTEDERNELRRLLTKLLKSALEELEGYYTSPFSGLLEALK